MYLQGQGSERGYAMAALLVSLGVMAILMSAALPVWRHQAQREKEHELVFRGQQYIRAINQYQRRMGPGVYPPSVDVLVQQRFLRKKYKDPVTDDDFDIIPVGGLAPGQGQGQPGGGPGRASTAGTGRGGIQAPPAIGRPPVVNPSSRPSPAAPAGRGQMGGGGQFVGGGIMGVRSKSKDASIRIYNGGTHYNEWNFIAMGIQAQPGGPGRGRGAPGMPGVGMPGGRGRGDGRGLGPGGGRGRGPGGGRAVLPGRGGRPPGGE
jgi:type II secretory pathway pseudopilin PulG